ncbi:hypothetical protein [Bradyrhizobium sp. LTSPM299]|uniref:hypothetical protein n=1 Tax=Bradyrhizobium sp. LTSPM299 TaxID=1619233 RepID=UPI000AFB0EAE|nr:hypothetical protein [Bradyrhizobium sp. LTSPM299]
MVIRIRTAPYRDIRTDLKDRLRTAVVGRDGHLAKAKEFDGEIDLLTKLLDQEERRFGQKPDVETSAASEKPPLGDFLLKKLEHSEATKDDLKVFAEHAGYFPDGTSAGRSIHSTLLNLVRSGKVTTVAEGIYTLAEGP